MNCIAPACRRGALKGGPFCSRHRAAPPAQQGGWLSAYKRRLALANHETPLDAHQVIDRLWMGARPPADRTLPMFGVVVLCAAEYQPRMAFAGPVLRCPLDDAIPTASEIAMATAVARQAAQVWRGGGRVLITCNQGRNRSGLVSGLVMLSVTGQSVDRIVSSIRRARGARALTNPHFVKVLERLEPPGRR